jgi:hypothetical protein
MVISSTPTFSCPSLFFFLFFVLGFLVRMQNQHKMFLRIETTTRLPQVGLFEKTIMKDYKEY